MTYQINQLTLSEADNFIYVIVDTKSKQAAVVDPAWNADTIKDHLDSIGVSLAAILITHTHADHTNALKPLLAITQKNIPVYISQDEAKLNRLPIVDKVKQIKDGDSISLGDSIIKAIATPGHTAGAMCYYLSHNEQSDIICGDTLFVYGCGRCDFSDSNVQQMYQSLKRLKTLPDNTKTWCGHNYSVVKTATIAEQKVSNPFLLIDDSKVFEDYRMNLHQRHRQMPYQPVSQAELNSFLMQHQSTAKI